MNADAIAEMMKNWVKTEAAARAAAPDASDEEVFQMTKAAMNKSLGLV